LSRLCTDTGPNEILKYRAAESTSTDHCDFGGFELQLAYDRVSDLLLRIAGEEGSDRGHRSLDSPGRPKSGMIICRPYRLYSSKLSGLSFPLDDEEEAVSGSMTASRAPLKENRRTERKYANSRTIYRVKVLPPASGVKIPCDDGTFTVPSRDFLLASS